MKVIQKFTELFKEEKNLITEPKTLELFRDYTSRKERHILIKMNIIDAFLLANYLNQNDEQCGVIGQATDINLSTELELKLVSHYVLASPDSIEKFSLELSAIATEGRTYTIDRKDKYYFELPNQFIWVQTVGQQRDIDLEDIFKSYEDYYETGLSYEDLKNKYCQTTTVVVRELEQGTSDFAISFPFGLMG